MPKELEKAYEAKKYEDGIYKRWEDSGFFNPDVCVQKGVTRSDAESFCIMLPPPNATGTLHIGHAMYTIEDVIIRFQRMRGRKTLWVPGTDHAAIATNAKVERLLKEKEGLTRYDLGREKFLERVNDFIKNSQGTINRQLRKMGFSLDWSREAYTFDEERNHAVRTVFKRMYDAGLIYRGVRVINWDPQAKSTISDDEVKYKEGEATLYTFRYSSDFPIPISTTRPETKVGDTAVAVHPSDERYKQYVGKEYNVDFAGVQLRIKIITNENIDPSFGTGALGVTPAHSATDADMARKNDLPVLTVINEDARMTQQAGPLVCGKTTLEARAKIVEWIKANNLLEQEETIAQNISLSERTGAVVEPLPKLQWFVDVNKPFSLRQSSRHPISGLKDGQMITLKELMRQTVVSRQIEIIPSRFEKIYFHWIDNLRDWNISRQIWFGHQIPVWYRGDEIYVDVDPPTGEGWEQDPDVLDTWFSSGIWTISALGWPGDTDDLQMYHPTNVLETGYDILFFWVARMILMTCFCVGEVPFKTVYLHGLVRDEQGRKMSKSLDNIIDPLDVSEKFGTDAVRLSLLIGTGPGQDKNLGEEKIAGFRNFTNKLWNISRFMLLNIENPTRNVSLGDKQLVFSLADTWILERLERVRFEVTNNLEKYQFSVAGERLRDFTWNELADWYLEIAKVEGNKSNILNYILDVLLKLWHPFMPFVTETIWVEVYGSESMLMVEKWPEHSTFGETAEKHILEHNFATLAERDFEIFQKIVTCIRNIRSEYNIELGKKVDVYVKSGKQGKFLGFTWAKDSQPQMFFEQNKQALMSLARLERIHIDEPIPKSALGFLEGDIEFFVDMAGTVDVEKEKARIQKEMEKVEPYVRSLEQKLAGNFAISAPVQIVEKEKQKLIEAKEKLENLQRQLTKLK